MIAAADTGAALTVDAHYAPEMLQFIYASETEHWGDGPSGPPGTPVGPSESRVRENGMLAATDFEREVTALMRGDTVAGMHGRPFPDSTLRGLELHALLAERRGDRENALSLWHRAAMLDDGAPIVGPPRALVARDRLAALLLAAGRPADAAAEYERSLNHAPNHSVALLGVARARVAAGDTAAAAMAYRRLLDNWRHADADLPGLAEARRGAAWAVQSRVTATAAPIVKQRVLFKNGPLVLEGFLFKPQGTGPFPAVVWNHGSEKNPGASLQFDSVAGVFVPHGYVVFAPTRRGHGRSDGEYVTDARGRVQAAKGQDAANRFITQALAGDQLSDQLAGLAFLKQLAFVDTSRMVVAGCSFGGIQTLLAAEGGHGFKAALPISPAALNWDRNPPLRARLLAGVARIKIPVMLLQPPRDASLGPSRDLGAEFARLHKAYSGKVYPDTIPARAQTHCFGGAMGNRVWAADAVAFFDSVLGRKE
jgi:carboxymethylenebutenolidase